MAKTQDEELMECIADGGDTAQTCGYQEKAKIEAKDAEQAIQHGVEKISPEEVFKLAFKSPSISNLQL